jgi:myo-inositol-1-phosphate synthase
MSRVGMWLIGARGSVATTAIAGAAAVARSLAGPTGLVTSRAPFDAAGLPELGELVVGGHDVTETPLTLRAAALADAGVLPPGIPRAVAPELDAAERELRFGITGPEARRQPRACIERTAADLRAFRTRHDLSAVVVVNVASTEAPFAGDEEADLEELLGRLPASSLYALAAIQEGCAFVDFTPSTGARLPAIEALARTSGAPLAGRDGKTGETFLKSALAPALAARALRVRSWAGVNLLGGGDGEALADPQRAASKLASKGRCLEEILGYPIEAPVRIENVPDLGEWKTAWDHVSFEGFLGVRMRLQLTWEGCDSSLAAPLVLDLVRLAGLALERGEAGVVPELGFFFKDPAGSNEHALDRQYELLRRWVGCEVPA